MPSTRYVAAEIEVSQADGNLEWAMSPLDIVVDKWKAAVVHDGSVGPNGFEINTAPASGNAFVAEINELCTALKAQEAQADEQCGCHIHIDARDYSYYELKRLLYLYAAIEPALYAMVPTSRRESHFCVPCGQKYFSALLAIRPEGPEARPGRTWRPQTVQRVVRFSGTQATISQRIEREDGDLQRLKRGVMFACYGHTDMSLAKKLRSNKGQGQSFRYRNLNLHSWFYRHTIEWRLPEGTVDPHTIINWGILFASILDTANKMSERGLIDLISKVAPPTTDCRAAVVGSTALLREISPTEDNRAWIKARVARFRGGPLRLTTEWMVFPNGRR